MWCQKKKKMSANRPCDPAPCEWPVNESPAAPDPPPLAPPLDAAAAAADGIAAPAANASVGGDGDGDGGSIHGWVAGGGCTNEARQSPETTGRRRGLRRFNFIAGGIIVVSTFIERRHTVK